MMSKESQLNIKSMRYCQKGYAEIARELSLKASSIRMYCYRNGLTDVEIKERSDCICCGVKIEQPIKGGRKIYCSERCRSAWRRLTQRLNETTYHHICEECMKPFDTKGNKNQKFCSQQCCYQHRRKHDQ